jgi:hypothetical protein
MFKNLSLRTKIFSLVSGVVVVSFLILTLAVSRRAFDMAKKDAFNLANETADKYKNEIKAELQGARITAETLSAVFESLKDNGVTDRKVMNDILRHALSKKEYITAFCIAYEPDALDGKDKTFAGIEPEYDGTGRFAPYWNKLGESIAVEPLYDIDIADWYIVPKGTLHEYITDPYPYEVQGNPVMLASIVFPILHDGKFIGIMASDFVLDKLQGMISKVNPHGQGGYTEIISNAGMVVAHPDKSHLGEDITETLLYEMLIYDRSKIGEAVKRASAYIAENSAEAPNSEDETAKRAGAERFAADLKEYAKTFDRSKLNLSLLTPEMARAILEADPDRLRYVTEAKNAIKNGETYISSSRDF